MAPVQRSDLGLVYFNQFSGSHLQPAQRLVGLPDNVNNQTGSGFMNEVKNFVFPLAGQPDWQLDQGNCNFFYLCFSKPWTGVVESICFAPLAAVAPTVSYAGSEQLGAAWSVTSLTPSRSVPGIIKLNSVHKQQTIYFSCQKYAGDHHAMLVEMSTPNIWFWYPNSSEPNEREFKVVKIIPESTGQVTCRRSDFGRGGKYYLRAWVLSGKNQREGLASNHVCIEVED
jgi:hypothetical protein